MLTIAKLAELARITKYSFNIKVLSISREIILLGKTL